MEKARVIDPFGHAGLTPLGKIRLTLAGEIKICAMAVCYGCHSFQAVTELVRQYF